MNNLNITDSNNEIIKLILKNEPFSIVRLGIGAESYISIEYLLTNKINIKYLQTSVNLNGVYSKTLNLKHFELFCQKYNEAIKECDLLACFNSTNITDIQNIFNKRYKLSNIHSRSLEPFYTVLDNQIPWSHYLKDKKVLIINPFVESFQKQLKNKFQIFKDKKIFLDDQEFIFYKAYQTIAGNHIHDSWGETFKIMCDDIKNIDFDIALLGCGGYGLPLCDFIKRELNKSAIYIGGGLQLLFGVMGHRWEIRDDWKKIIRENNTKFIRPSKEEMCENFKTIENGCYW